MSIDRLLLEDSARIWLEDFSGFLLLETSTIPTTLPGVLESGNPTGSIVEGMNPTRATVLSSDTTGEVEGK